MERGGPCKSWTVSRSPHVLVKHRDSDDEVKMTKVKNEHVRLEVVKRVYVKLRMLQACIHTCVFVCWYVKLR